MQLPNDEPTLCAVCEKKPATEQYTCAGHTQGVCATCFDRLTVQDALEDKLTHVLDLERRRQYDEAIACLDTFMEMNHYRDHDGWLANSIALHRSSIFLDAGRYVEAEQAHNDWTQIGFFDLWRQQLHALGMAKTLEALGRDREAVTVLEGVLGREEPKDLLLALTVLTELVRISDKLALPVDPAWLRVAEAVAKEEGVEMPAADSPAGAILALKEILRSRQ